MILAMEGSTDVCSAALMCAVASDDAVGDGEHQGGGRRWRVAARRRAADGRNQARMLLPLVEEMLHETGRGPGEIGAVIVGVGPGTFTGVRIVVATGRALGLALSTPVLGVSSLAALAAGAMATSLEGRGSRGALLVPVVDARRGQVFYAVYESVHDDEGLPEGCWRRTEAYAACDRGEVGTMVAAHFGRPVTVVAARRELVGDLPEQVGFLEMEVGAEWLLVGQEALEEPGERPEGRRLAPWLVAPVAGPPGAAGTPESVKPVYVRPPDADVHITKMKDPWGHGLERE